MKKTMWLITIGLCAGLFFSCKVAAQETIKIAAIFAKTGEAAEDHKASLDGVRMAVNEINHSGGVLGKKFELLEIDNCSTPIGSKMAANKAVEAGVIGILGSAWSTYSLPIAKVAQANKTPMITNISTHPDITKTGDYIFRVCFTDIFQAKVLAQFVYNDLKAGKAVIFKNVNSDYSMKLSEEFRKDFEKAGGKILLELHYLQKDRDFKKLLQEVKLLSPDVLVLTGHDESGVIVKQAIDARITAIPVGGDGWEGPSFYDRGGSLAPRAYFSSHWSPEIDTEIVKNFLNRYKNYGNIDASTVLSYDTVFLLADAINRAGSLERAEIRKALADTVHFHGVTGDISFDENRDPIKNVVINQIVNGKQHYLKTVNILNCIK